MLVIQQALLVADRGRRFLQTLAQKRFHLFQEAIAPVNGVIDPEPFTAIDDNRRFFQIGKVPGDRRLREKERRDNVADTEFTFSIEEHQDAQAGFVGECFKELDMSFHGQNYIRLQGYSQFYFLSRA